MVDADLSLYFHIPFCKRKCPYCHFFILPDKELFKTDFLSALHQEISLLEPLWKERKIVSIYFGGGTPSLIGPDAISQILTRLPFTSPCEITLETNPESLTKETAEAFVHAGVNRFSLGVQSFDNEQLKLLGREHSAQEAIKAIYMLNEVGVDNISIDLMYELPRQTLSNWQQSLDQLRTLPITHISLYNLTFEPRSLFFKQQKELAPTLPLPEASHDMLTYALELFAKLGFHRYEISAFAKEGFPSVHNSGYWTGREFLGLGPSAFSYHQKKRFSNVSHLGKYVRCLKNKERPIDFTEELPYPDNLHELLAVQLRLTDGVDLSLFEKKHGALPPETRQKLSRLTNEGFLEASFATGSQVKLSEKGLLFYDTVASELI